MGGTKRRIIKREKKDVKNMSELDKVSADVDKVTSRGGLLGSWLKGRTLIEAVRDIPRERADAVMKKTSPESGTLDATVLHSTSRRDFLRLVATGAVATSGLLIAASAKKGEWVFLTNPVKDVFSEEKIKEAEVHWCTILQKGQGGYMARLINVYTPEVINKKKSLDAYNQWESSTALGLYMKGYSKFVLGLLTEGGRKALAVDISDVSKVMDTAGYSEAINGVSRYANNGDLTMDGLKKYFVSNLGYSERDWKLLEKVFGMVRMQNTVGLQSMLRNYSSGQDF